MKECKKYTVITGASSGIGYETAKAFAARGKHLIIIARRRQRLEQLAQEIAAANQDIDVIICQCDLSEASNAVKLYESLRAYQIETWINNAGFGSYAAVAAQDPARMEAMLQLNVISLTTLSALFVRDYQDVPGTQLINLSSRGGYMIVPDAVTYCASKFYVGAFTEGLAHELRAAGAGMQAKVLAPAATETEFGRVANDTDSYRYEQRFKQYHSAAEMAGFLLQLFDSSKTVGIVDWQTFTFTLCDTIFDYAGDPAFNQQSSNCSTKL